MYSPTLMRWIQPDPTGADYIDGANLYLPESANPISHRDPSGLYDMDGHFYTTYMTAIAAGLSVKDAYELAYYSQMPDQIDDYAAPEQAIAVGSSLLKGGTVDQDRVNWMMDVHMLQHSLFDGTVAEVNARRACLKKLIKEGGLSNWAKGFLIHALGDAYGHTRNNGTGYPPGLGHAEDNIPRVGYFPDTIASSPTKFIGYIGNLFDALGGTTNPGALPNMGELNRFSTTLPTDQAAALKMMADHATSVYGYGTVDPLAGIGAPAVWPYRPNDKALDGRLPIPNRTDVGALMKLISEKCNCGMASNLSSVIFPILPSLPLK
jgi:hypothetical protein